MDASPPTFHPPTPASTLLTRLRNTQTDPSTGLTLPRLRNGVEDIDEYLLGGGFQRGCIVGVSSGYGGSGRGAFAAREAEGGDTGRLLTLHILARELLERPYAQASVIDATGSFPLSLLAQVIRWRAERGVGLSAEGGRKGGGKGGGVEERVNSVLERVGITRVFDVEGLWEVLGEVGGAAVGGDEGVDDGGGGGEVAGGERDALDGEKGEERREGDGRHEEVLERIGTPEIMDSEDDDDDDDLATQRPPKPDPQPPNKERNAPTTPSKTHHTTELLLVDNLTTLISTLFARTSPSAAHALLAQLSHTLSTLTHSSSLTVFLLNTLVTKSAKGESEGKPDRRQHSVFAAMRGTPSLGMVFDSFVDLHLMCHALPRGVGDAEGVYGCERAGDEEGSEGVDGGGAEGRGDGRLGRGAGEEVRFANVVEVLKDECPQLERWEGVMGAERPGRWVNREQRWATFGVKGGVGLEDEGLVGAERKGVVS